MYAVSKLYADLVADDGTVAICYLGRLSLGPFRRDYAALELYGPAGDRAVLHAPAPADLAGPPAGGRLDVVLETPRGRARFVHRPLTTAPAPVSEVSRAVRWSVVSAVAEAELTWLDADTPSLHGSGYSDWVVLRRPTRFLGFSSLQWGRARFGDEAFVYGALDFADGRLWRFGLRAAAGRTPLAIPVESVVTGEGRTDVSFGHDGLLALEPLRVLHDGPALDSARFPQAVERALVRAANGAAFETRWVSRARLGDRSGLALHERVSFG